MGSRRDAALASCEVAVAPCAPAASYTAVTAKIPEPSVPRLAVATVFFVNGAVLASWVPHIPMVQMKLALSPAVLGFALLGMAAGALMGIPLAGWWIPRVGSRMVVRVSAIVFFAALGLPILAPNLPLLIAALVLLGASNGAMDVSMNAQAVAVERQLSHPIMSSFHGMWSVGGLAGAGVCALALHLGVDPVSHVLGAAVVWGTIGAVALRQLLPPSADIRDGGPRIARPSGLLIGLGMMALLALLAEGSMGDWSAVYLRLSLGTSAGLAALGFAAFQLTMAAGRFAGDRLVARLGNESVVRASATFAAAGLGAALMLSHPVAALIGCACVGLGLSNLIPILFRSASQIPGVAAGHGIAAVSTAGYCGFLAGPPLIGLCAEALTLPAALGIVVAALAWIAMAARRISVPVV